MVAISCSLLATFSGCGRPKVHQTHSIRVADPKSLSKNNLEKLTKIVEEKIRNILPHALAIVFDGWTTSDSHYITMYATFADDCTLGYKSVLLALSPFESEDSQSAENHYEFLLFVLELFGKSIENSVALVDEN